MEENKDNQDSQKLNQSIETGNSNSHLGDVANADQPVVQKSAHTTTDVAKPSPVRKHGFIHGLLIIVVLLVVLGVGFLGGYEFKKVPAKIQNAQLSSSFLSVPMGASIVQTCQPGLGEQYIMPKDIPNGPIYNVYRGKVIGLEYMEQTSKISLTQNTMLSLNLMNQRYDHIDIMKMQAHAGFPHSHYMIVAMAGPSSVTDNITCGTGSSKMNMSSTPSSQSSKGMSNMAM